MKRKKAVLGAATDDPVLLAKRARRAAETAVRNDDDLALREAAETGWLAISSLADVAAARLGRGTLGGAQGRKDTVRELEDRAKLRRGTILTTFQAARTVLHGECFHGAECSTQKAEDVLDLLEEVQVKVGEGMAAISKAKRRSK